MSPVTTESARWRRYFGAGGWGAILTVLMVLGDGLCPASCRAEFDLLTLAGRLRAVGLRLAAVSFVALVVAQDDFQAGLGARAFQDLAAELSRCGGGRIGLLTIATPGDK